MKFIFTPKFRRDYKCLEVEAQEAVRGAKETIKLALEGDVECYKTHRIKRMEGHPKIWEGHVKDNLCFTFHDEKTDSGEKIVFFRRVGTHEIYKRP